jgi:probable S-adenosylmethionine-dependent methyltransferase, YraL family
MLYIVPTPIGNLQDITLRCLDALKKSDFIFCEDTRQTKKLLDNYGVSAQTLRYNEDDPYSLERCLSILESGKICSLVSDAGTPCVSDPGWKLVKEARAKNIKIEALPGPSALTCALSGAGFGGGGFTFLGFMPRKNGKITKLLGGAFALERPVVVYESPYRIIKFLELVKTEFGPQIKVALARELTKTFEEWICGNVEDALKNLSSRKKILGEFVVVLDARTKEQKDEED